MTEGSGSAPRRRTRRAWWPWVLGALLAGGGAFAAVRMRGGSQKPLDPALIVASKRGDLAIDVIETGKVQPHDKVEVKSKVAGQVARVLVEEGQRVRKGQLLLGIDQTDFQRDVAQQQATVARTTADLASAQNALEFAKSQLVRKERGLLERGVAQTDVDAARSEVRARQAAVGIARATVAGAKVAFGAASDRLRYTQIIAPMSGTVIERGIQPGEVVTPGVQATFEGKALLTIADLSTLVVKADLNQIDVARVRMGQSATLTPDALPGRKFGARVTKIAPASTIPKGKDVDVFPIEATLESADPDIKPGMTADLRIHIDVKKAVLSLPIEAIVKEAGKSWVNRIVDDKGKQTTEKIEVAVGARNDREVEITSGVKEGEKFLIKPASSSENEYK